MFDASFSNARAIDRFASLLRSAGRAAARLIAPDHCAACDAPLGTEAVFCSGCGPVLSPATEDVASGIHVAGTYTPPLSTAIVRMKFGHRADLAYRLARLLPIPSHAGARGLLVVPVPLHLLRLCERGFNPSALLARQLATRARASFAPELLSRARDTPHQSRLPARERRSNVAEAFVASPRGAAGRHAVLVDDVVTTGSTVEACSRALYAAGVVHVSVVALAVTKARE